MDFKQEFPNVNDTSPATRCESILPDMNLNFDPLAIPPHHEFRSFSPDPGIKIEYDLPDNNFQFEETIFPNNSYESSNNTTWGGQGQGQGQSQYYFDVPALAEAKHPVDNNLGHVTVTGSFICRYFNCTEKFKTTALRNKHERAVHIPKVVEGQGQGQGQFSDIVQTKKKLEPLLKFRSEKVEKTEKSHICPHCSKIFKTLSNLTQHIRVHTGELKYQCRFCEVKFRDTTQRSRHEISRHKGGVKRYECEHVDCGHTAETPAALATHMRSHTGEKPYTCDICEKKFISRSHLVQHTRIHTGEKPFKCRMCELTFTDTSTRKRHERKVHSGEKPEKRHLCEECGQSFTLSLMLIEHLRTHSGEKPYKCELESCDAHFARKSSLRIHKRIHSGEKPYQCDYCPCPEKFINMSGKKRHELTHSGLKAFVCSFCSNKFATAEGMKLHERVHTGEKPFVCSFCPSAFASQSNLKYHVQVNHSKPDDKLFKCDVCEKTFVRAGEYKRHVVTHSGEKHFKCSFCHVAYNRMDKLKHHVSGKHKDESSGSVSNTEVRDPEINRPDNPHNHG